MLHIKIYQGVTMGCGGADLMALFPRNERMSSTGFQGSQYRTSLSDTEAVQHKL